MFFFITNDGKLPNIFITMCQNQKFPIFNEIRPLNSHLRRNGLLKTKTRTLQKPSEEHKSYFYVEKSIVELKEESSGRQTSERSHFVLILTGILTPRFFYIKVEPEATKMSLHRDNTSFSNTSKFMAYIYFGLYLHKVLALKTVIGKNKLIEAT